MAAPPLTGATAQAYQSNPNVRAYLNALAASQGSSPVGGAAVPPAQPTAAAFNPGNMYSPYPGYSTSADRRVDQGQDIQGTPGAPVDAAFAGTVVDRSDPSGFGPNYPVLDLSTPYDGYNAIYYGHALSDVPSGTQVQQGQQIGTLGTSPVGNATSPGWLEMGFWGPNGPIGNGQAMAAALGSDPNVGALGSVTGSLVGSQSGPYQSQYDITGAQNSNQAAYNQALASLTNQNAEQQWQFLNQQIANANQVRGVQAPLIQQNINTQEQAQQYEMQQYNNQFQNMQGQQGVEVGQYGLQQANLQNQQAALANQARQGLYNQQSADTASGNLISPGHTYNMDQIMGNYQQGVEGLNNQIAQSYLGQAGEVAGYNTNLANTQLGQKSEYVNYLNNLAQALGSQSVFNLGYNNELLQLQQGDWAKNYQESLTGLNLQNQNQQLDLNTMLAGAQLAQQLGALSNQYNPLTQSYGG